MPRKSSKRKGGKKRDKAGNTGRDPVTGRYMQEMVDGRTFLVRDDAIYQNDVGKWENPSDWNNASDDVLTLLQSVPTETNGIHISYPDAIIQWQLGDNAVVGSTSYDTIRTRTVYLGDFKYDKNGKLISGRIDYHARLEEKPSDPTWIGGGIYQAQDTLYRPLTEWDNYGIEIVDVKQSTGGLAAIRAFGGGKYFFEGWDNNVFDPTIV
jgi:hypothetical protein